MTLSPDVVERAWAAGAQRFPEVALTRDDFAAYLEERAAAWGGALERAPDLYLACACLRQVPQAAETFVALYCAKVPAYLGRNARSADFVNEVQQQLAIAVLVGTGDKPPRLHDYSGRGSLEGWVRVAAVRVAQRLGRGQERRASWEAAVEPEVLGGDRELAYLKQAYREPFRHAFRAAVAALSPGNRALLRLHYLEGTTTARLAAMHQVSRPTIVRRIAEARAALAGGVEEHLRATLGLAPEELESVVRLVRSRIDVSLSRLLADTPEEAPGSPGGAARIAKAEE